MKNRFIFDDPVLSYYGFDPAILEGLEGTAKHLRMCEILSKHIAVQKQEINVPRFKKLQGGSSRIGKGKEDGRWEDVNPLRYLRIHGKLEKLENRMTVI
jgi:hypothetical protein